MKTYELWRWNKREHNVIYNTINNRYNDESIIVRSAYIFATELLLSPINLKEDIIIYNTICTRRYTMGGEQLDKEIEHLLGKYPEQKDLCNDIYKAREIGMLQRSAGGHVGINLELLFSDGYQGRIIKAKNKLTETKDIRKTNFYKSQLIVLIAAQKYILRYVKTIDEMICRTENYEYKKKLMKIKDTCSNIAYYPPRNLIEAVQMVAFTMMFNFVEGNGAVLWGIRIDQLLNQYYLNGINNGDITRAEAVDVICSLWRMFDSLGGERSANLTLGGCNQAGDDMSNEMTLICMEASIIVKADVPLLTLRVHPNLNEKVWETALMLVKSGQGFPAFYNDEAVITARMNAGVSREDAYDYSTLGCVETTIAGREYSHTEGARINMLKLLELMLFQGECTLTGQNWNLKENHNLAEFATFEQFYAWYKIELEALVCKVAKFIDESSILYSEYWPSPYLSSITWGCMENGSDITDNGTKYYNLSINCAGMANTVDSLEAIEQAVFKERSVTFEQLKDAIKNNFLGYEELREKLLKYPKYGNDIDSVDNKMSDLMEFFTETVYKQKMIGNRGKFQCGFYTVMHHALMGIKTGASCDGRYAQTSLANSLSPSQGMDVNGSTAVINSINKISMKYMGNGADCPKTVSHMKPC